MFSPDMLSEIRSPDMFSEIGGMRFFEEDPRVERVRHIQDSHGQNPALDFQVDRLREGYRESRRCSRDT